MDHQPVSESSTNVQTLFIRGWDTVSVCAAHQEAMAQARRSQLVRAGLGK